MNTNNSIKHIVILVFPDSTLLSIAGPLEIFTKAITESCEMPLKSNPHYQLHIVSANNTDQVNTSSNLKITTEGVYTSINYPIDTLILSGTSLFIDYTMHSEVLQWIKNQSKLVRRICSICTGAFVLAEAGVLDGKKATTHWQHCKKLADLYSKINVEIAPLFVKDKNIYTSAGISSGMDLALALIEEDMGRLFALQIAKWMVLFLKRSGNQIQYSNLPDHQEIGNLSIRKICGWIFNHLNEDLPVEKLAEQASMSPRNFARVFVRELNITPAKYIDRLRVENASQYLIETQLSLDKIGELCGVKNADNLRRLFIKVLDTTPTQYKKNFNSTI